jgi:hypothetical protein
LDADGISSLLNKSGSGLIFGELTLISSDSSTENFDLTPFGHFFNGLLGSLSLPHPTG